MGGHTRKGKSHAVRIVNEALLREFHRDVCRHCGRRRPTCGHHVFARQVGNAGRIDARWNLCALCVECHSSSHDGNEPTRSTLLAYQAQDHGCLQDDLIEAKNWLRRMDKHAARNPEWLETCLVGLKPHALRLVREALEECK